MQNTQIESFAPHENRIDQHSLSQQVVSDHQYLNFRGTKTSDPSLRINGEGTMSFASAFPTYSRSDSGSAFRSEAEKTGTAANSSDVKQPGGKRQFCETPGAGSGNSGDTTSPTDPRQQELGRVLQNAGLDPNAFTDGTIKDGASLQANLGNLSDQQLANLSTQLQGDPNLQNAIAQGLPANLQGDFNTAVQSGNASDWRNLFNNMGSSDWSNMDNSINNWLTTGTADNVNGGNTNGGGDNTNNTCPPGSDNGSGCNNNGGSCGGNSGGDTGGSTGGDTGGSTGGDTGGSTGGDTGGSTGGDTGGSTGGDTGGSTGGDTGGSTGGAGDFSNLSGLETQLQNDIANGAPMDQIIKDLESLIKGLLQDITKVAGQNPGDNPKNPAGTGSPSGTTLPTDNPTGSTTTGAGGTAQFHPAAPSISSLKKAT